MNINLLIDNIVRQTTVLVAQLATAAGGRTPLAHVAGQVFIELVRELKSQGLTNKVIADMFGLTLRTYHDRVRRSSESQTDRGSSLWEAVLAFVRERQVVRRAELLQRFRADDEASVRAVLNDLVESGLLFKSGRVDHTAYRAASAAETAAMSGHTAAERLPLHVLVCLHRQGPLSCAELAAQLNLSVAMTGAALEELVRDNGVTEQDGVFTAPQCVIPYGDEVGWEAAVFDHFQSMATAIAAKVTQGNRSAQQRDATGGSTYHFDLYRGHPLESEVLGLLGSVREKASQLREQVDAMVAPHVADKYRVVFYAGQNAVGLYGRESGVDE